MVFMYDEDGAPICDKRGNPYEYEFVDGIPPEQITDQLTKRIRRELNADGNGFNSPLNLTCEAFV
jgi:hypothetical protein